MFASLCNHFAIGMVAYKNADIRFAILVSGHQKVFMPEDINIAPLKVGLIGVEVLTQGVVMKIDSADP